ncbi:DctP family TRAP transporter solute-binding subunit [Propionivibrio limicola]|uniref:DctP family TRAP transporter solute-binding subunit n=1 Tax=Propionivibrio limicola TaxID=167645 RepID=UPI0014789D45|nr:DctP family TRAP transporter solute-binding subunit [Propionivibrio limicola]
MVKAMKGVFAAMAACGLMLSAVTANAADIKDRTLRIACAATPGNPQYDGAQKFSELVAQKSGGKIKVKVFGGATLGKDLQVVSAMQGGIVDMGVMNTNLLVGVTKEAGLLDLPFLFDSEKEAYAVLDSAVGKKIHAALEPKGLIGLGYFDMGYYNLHNSKRPITKLEDMQGLKMRVTETPISIETMAALGGNPVPIPYSELYTVLEQNVVDGGGQPPLNMIFGKIGEVQKFYSINKYSFTPQSLLLSKKTWEKLSADEKNLMQEAAKEAADAQRQMSLKKSAESLVELKRTTKINEVSPAEIARMKEKTKPVVEKFAKEYNEALAKELFAEIAKVRKAKN